MKKLLLSVTCFALLLLGSESGFANSTIQLAKGEQYRISVSPEARYSVGNPEVIRVKRTIDRAGKSVLLVVAKSIGYSDLVMMREENDKVYKFQVFAKRSAAIAKDIRAYLAGIPGIKIRRSGSMWVIRGNVLSVDDYIRIKELQRSQPKRVRFIGGIAGTALNVAKVRIEESLESAGLQGVSVRLAGEHIWLEGKVSGNKQKLIANAIAKKIHPEISSHIQVAFEDGETLKFQVQMMEAIRADREKTGFGWSTDIPKLFQVHKHFLKADFSLASSLEFLASKGLIRMLSKPMIYVNERGKAELKVGGEIPLKIQSRRRNYVDWKPYGLLLQIEVPGHANGLTRAKIKIEMSDLDYANAIDGLPGLRVNKMETVVDLSNGKTVFLSGLLQTQKQENEQGIALLKDIPVIGELFKSKNFIERKSELLIAVTANTKD